MARSIHSSTVLTVAAFIVLSSCNKGTDSFSTNPPPEGSILLEMPSDDRLRIEWFNTHEPATEFTAASRLYER